MKYAMIYLCSFVLVSGQAWSEEAKEIKSDKDKLSYSIGASIGKNLKKETVDVDLGLLIKGLENGLTGEKLAIPEKEVRQVMSAYQSELRKKLMVNRQQAAEENKKKSEAFLAENKAKKGVTTLPSGVQYTIIKEGKGKKPTESDMVEVNYRGALANGTEFDATEPGHPANLKVSSLIAGWKQALSMMPAGSKWQIVIPPQLAYGERGVGSYIGPNEALVFEVELLAIK